MAAATASPRTWRQGSPSPSRSRAPPAPRRWPRRARASRTEEGRGSDIISGLECGRVELRHTAATRCFGGCFSPFVTGCYSDEHCKRAWQSR
eukprot:scaffold31704_cov61-Phaeocystis_antarctica.AAC.3